MTKASLTGTPVVMNREERRFAERHPEQAELPILLKKIQVAELLQCSGRQVELMAQAGRIPMPIYLAQRSPRWKRDELLAFIAAAGN